MREQIRAYVEAGLGALSPTAARDMAKSLLQGEGRDRVQRLAQDLMEWSARSRERVTEIVQREVQRQLKAVGVATREDLDALRKRVRDLEKAQSTATGSTGRRTTAKRATAKSSAAKRATPAARRSRAGRSGAGTTRS